MRLIVQTASSLALINKENTLSYDGVLLGFASSVALAQIYLAQNVRNVIDFKKEKVLKELRIEHVATDSQSKEIKKPSKDKIETHLETNLRNQILLYAISVFSLYGFQDVMEQLMKNKALL